MNPVRSIVAVLCGIVLVSVVVEVLEFTLVNARAGGRITDMPGYFAVLNRPGMTAARFAYNAVAAFLGGYLTARIAGHREMLHGAIAAVMKSGALIWGFTAGEYATFTPLPVRVALVLLTAPAMIAGSALRAAAARATIQSHTS